MSTLLKKTSKKQLKTVEAYACMCIMSNCSCTGCICGCACSGTASPKATNTAGARVYTTGSRTNTSHYSMQNMKLN